MFNMLTFGHQDVLLKFSGFIFNLFCFNVYLFLFILASLFFFVLFFAVTYNFIIAICHIVKPIQC